MYIVCLKLNFILLLKRLQDIGCQGLFSVTVLCSRTFYHKFGDFKSGSIFMATVNVSLHHIKLGSYVHNNQKQQKMLLYYKLNTRPWLHSRL